MGTTPTGEQILALPMAENDAGAATIRDYMAAIVQAVWDDRGGNVSGKRPFGSSGWRHDLYEALGDAGHIAYEDDESGYCREADTELGDQLIVSAIAALGAPSTPDSQETPA